MATQIGEGIDRARRGRSDQWIAGRTQALGHALSRTAVSEYRRGKRKTISVTDLFAIAGALGVPPVTILFPGLPDGRVRLLPVLGEVNAFDALRWATGERQTFPKESEKVLSFDADKPESRVEGLREYRRSLEYNCGPYDLQNEDNLSPEMQILSAGRDLERLLRDARKMEDELTLDRYGATSNEKQREALRRHVEFIEQIRQQVDSLEAKIVELGGMISEERVTQSEEASNDGARPTGD